jgi:hypothetical protein
VTVPLARLEIADGVVSGDSPIAALPRRADDRRKVALEGDVIADAEFVLRQHDPVVARSANDFPCNRADRGPVEVGTQLAAGTYVPLPARYRDPGERIHNVAVAVLADSGVDHHLAGDVVGNDVALLGPVAVCRGHLFEAGHGLMAEVFVGSRENDVGHRSSIPI